MLQEIKEKAGTSSDSYWEEKYKLIMSLKGPFLDLPFTNVLFTDQTGNNVIQETIVYPTLSEYYDKDFPDIADNSTYGILNLNSTVTVPDIYVYDTTYKGHYTSNKSTVISRTSFILDDMTNKDLPIDLSKEELHGIYKELVDSRY